MEEEFLNGTRQLIEGREGEKGELSDKDAKKKRDPLKRSAFYCTISHDPVWSYTHHISSTDSLTMTGFRFSTAFVKPSLIDIKPSSCSMLTT